MKKSSGVTHTVCLSTENKMGGFPHRVFVYHEVIATKMAAVAAVQNF